MDMMSHTSEMEDAGQRMEVQRTIAAEPSTIFRWVASP
jgi:hypothetical protein